ncbi:IPT/TIG domain-containing protein [Longimicrobium sp.]|uniref:IPT/TIG domain-containing protein n=1 Tax=Longimicrobium sp. TaxID=2029185 RepID=UPI002E36260E|nr:IPT/TIG domain-containing protein [Longimicrobium sp.]HEX6041174.1 IPT/TIG domain-containing protein [Longimicrobium sp.]
MHTHVSRTNPPRFRHVIAAALALLLALGAAGCTDEALVSPEGIRPMGTAAPLVSLTPDTAFVGDTGVVLTIRGSGFTTGSTVSAYPWLPLITNVVDDSTLTARIEMPLWQVSSHQVWVLNEEYESSDPLTFEVVNPVPVITRMTPDGCEVSAADCGTVTLHGRNFLPGVQVAWDGSTVNSSRQSDSVITVQVDPYQLQWTRVVQVTAVNPQPGGGASAPVPFQVGPRLVMHTSGARVGSAGFNLVIFGDALGTSAQVYWNGAPRQTYIYNGRRISAYIPASDLATAGEAVVTVTSSGLPTGWRAGTVTVRPQPAATITSQLTLNLPVRDLVYNPRTERLYGTVYDGSMTSSVAVIDPATGSIENLIWVGDSPRYLALSEDGRFLWVGVDGEFSVKRVNLDWGGYPDATIQLDSGVVAEDLAPVPGVTSRVAISRRNTAVTPGHAGVAIYTAYYSSYQLPTATAAGAGSNVIEFGRTGATLYGVDNETSANQWRTMQVDDNGVSVTRTGFGWAGVGSDVVYAGGRLYSTSGTTVDTGHHDYAGIFHTLQGAVRPDVGTGRAFFLAEDAIRVGDINTFTQMGALAMPTLQFEPAPQRRHLVRWGADGLAFHDADEVFILRTPLAGN